MGAERTDQPQRIVTDSTSFDIILASRGKRLFLQYTPEENLITRVEDLTKPEEDRITAETEFTGITRDLIMYGLGYKGAKVSPGSEEIGPEMDVFDQEKLFTRRASQLARDFDYPVARVKELVSDVGKLVKPSEIRIGFLLPVVKEEIARLHGLVDVTYQELEHPTSPSHKR